MIDILAGVRAYLTADAGVAAQLQGGVYVGELDGVEIGQMPRRTAVIVPRGGTDNRSFIQVSSPRIEVWCYGNAYADAAALDLAIADTLSQLSRVIAGGVLIHSVVYASGPMIARDVDTDWPVVIRSYTVTAAELAAS